MNVLLLGPAWRNRTVKSFLEDNGCRVTVYEDPVSLEFCTERQIDWIIANGYAPIIKEPLISAYDRRIVNMHPAYLPHGRGIYPNVWCLVEGRQTGVSIHFIDAGIDTGDVIARKCTSAAPGDTLESFYDSLLRETEQLFFELWRGLSGGHCAATRQENVMVQYRTRLAGEKLMDLFDQRWQTPTLAVEELGADFWLGQQFWDGWREAEPRAE